MIDKNTLIEKYKSGKPVYVISCVMFNYYVESVRVVGLSFLNKECISCEIASERTSQSRAVFPYELFETAKEANNKCDKLQKEQGRVIITQKEYDNLIDRNKLIKKLFPLGVPRTREDWNYGINARAVYEAIMNT